MKAQSDLLTQFGAQAASQKILVGDMNSIFGYILTALLDHDARLTALEPTPEAATAPPAATPASPAPAPPQASQADLMAKAVAALQAAQAAQAAASAPTPTPAPAGAPALSVVGT